MYADTLIVRSGHNVNMSRYCTRIDDRIDTTKLNDATIQAPEGVYER